MISTVPRVLLGLFFCVSAGAKLAGIEDFELYIFSFGFASFDLCTLAARLIIAGEFILGLGLVSGWWHHFVNSVTAALLLGFSAFLLWRMSLGDTESCHCFGNLVDMNPAQSLAKNAAALALLILAWVFPGELFSPKALSNDKDSEDGLSSPGGWEKFRRGVYSRKAAIAAGLSAAVLVAVPLINPPDFWFRLTGHTSSDLNAEKFREVADTTSLLCGRQMVCFYSINCSNCRQCAEKMAGIISRDNLPLERIHCFFLEEYVDMPQAIGIFYDKFGAGLHLPFLWATVLDFLPMTNGSMPLVCLFEDGALVKEYDRLTVDEGFITEFLSAE